MVKAPAGLVQWMKQMRHFQLRQGQLVGREKTFNQRELAEGDARVEGEGIVPQRQHDPDDLRFGKTFLAVRRKHVRSDGKAEPAGGSTPMAPSISLFHQ